MFLKLAYKSLLSRKGSVTLTLLCIIISIFVLLGVEHIRHQAKNSFSNTVSGVDLIVGARTGSLNLLLYSVFHIGNPTNNISWDIVNKIQSSRDVEWTIPISLGDSHKGYRVMGTTADFFSHFKYGQKKLLQMDEGKAFSEVFDVVLGAEVARELGYTINDKLTMAHGIAQTSFSLHDDKPFTVVGILKPTGTPVDQTLHVSLEGIEALHTDRPDQDLTPESVTAVMLGLKSKTSIFRLQRGLNLYAKEPLTAILPGVVLSELWQMMSIVENILKIISVLVMSAALLGLCAMLLASMRERLHEIKLLRAIGAPSLFLFLLIELEALLITLSACFIAVLALFSTTYFLEDVIAQRFGIIISAQILSPGNLYLLSAIVLSSMIICAIPAGFTFCNASKK